jgi:hypothetical protein
MLFLLAALGGGVLLTYLWDDDAPLMARLCAGGPIGMALFGLLAFLLCCLGGMNGLTLSIAASITFFVPLLLARPYLFRLQRDGKRALSALRKPRRRTVMAALYFVLLGLFLLRFFQRTVMETPDGGISTAVWDNYADLAYHLAITMGFASGNNFPPESPLLSDSRLTYPFLVDFTVGAFLHGGMSRASAFLAQNVLLAVSMVGLLYRFTLIWLRDRTAAFLASPLLLLSGGLGFLVLIPEARETAGGWGELLQHLPHDYTEWDAMLFWGNPLVYWFGPMRSMLLGAPLMLTVWTLWWQALSAPPARARRLLLGAGFLIGLMPLAHAHTFLLTFAMGIAIALFFRRVGRFLPGMALAAVLAAPQTLLLASGTATRAQSFFGPAWGWMATENSMNIAVFWLLNLGFFLPVLLAALLLRGRGGRARGQRLRFYLPFLLCFIAPNLVKFAPWAWDNIKVLYVWAFASVPLVASYLSRLWRGKVSGGRGVASVLLVLLTLSGGVDVWRVVSGQTDWGIYSTRDIAVAKAIERETPPRSRILSAPLHNTPAWLAGRRAVLGYPGFVWTNGLPYDERLGQVREIYTGGPKAEELLKRLGIDYVAVGPQERSWASQENVKLNEAFFRAHFPSQEIQGTPGQSEDKDAYRLYKVR